MQLRTRTASMPVSLLKTLRRWTYEKACSLLQIVPKGKEGGFEPFSKPARNIPHFVSFNTKVNPYHTVPKALLKAHMRIISHFLARKIEKQYFKAPGIDENLPDYCQIQQRFEFLRERGVNIEDEPDLAGMMEINQLYEGFVKQGKIDICPPHEPFDEEEIGILDKIIRTRRSVRCWTDEPVSRETIQRAIESAVWAPSTGNFQAVRYIVIDDEETKSEIATGGFAGKSIPMIVAVAVDMRVYPSASIGNKAQDAAAAIQTFLLKAHVCGLGAVWISGKSVNKESTRDVLKLPEYMDNIAFIYLGWPANTPLTPPRTSTSEVTFYNRFREEAPWDESAAVVEDDT